MENRLKNNDRQPEVLVRVKQGNSFNTAGSKEDAGDMLNRYTMFIFGIAAFVAGSWAIACLSKVLFKEGPLSLLKQLAAALMG